MDSMYNCTMKSNRAPADPGPPAGLSLLTGGLAASGGPSQVQFLRRAPDPGRSVWRLGMARTRDGLSLPRRRAGAPAWEGSWQLRPARGGRRGDCIRDCRGWIVGGARRRGGRILELRGLQPPISKFREGAAASSGRMSERALSTCPSKRGTSVDGASSAALIPCVRRDPASNRRPARMRCSAGADNLPLKWSYGQRARGAADARHSR